MREAFESALQLMIEMFERDIKTTDKSGRDRVLAITALCVDGMVLARSVLLGGWR